MFAPFMPPAAVEECLPPKLSELAALRCYLEIAFPNWFKPSTDPNTLVALKNKMAPAVKEAELRLYDVGKGSRSEDRASSPGSGE